MQTVKNAYFECTSLSELAQHELVEGGIAPAASIAVAFRSSQDPTQGESEAGWTVTAGAAGAIARGEPTTVKTPFDLASLTKPFVAVTAARLADQGVLNFDLPLGKVLPELRGSISADTTLDELLSHRAGLHAHLRLYSVLEAQRSVHEGRSIREASDARRVGDQGDHLQAPFPPVYSDLGYLLAGRFLERIAGCALDDLVEKEVAKPLGLQVGSARQWLRRAPQFIRRVAPTEVVPWRGGLLRGIVHDENAWALAGHAVAGHAGLFGAVQDVATLGINLLDALAGRSHWLSQSILEERLLQPRAGGTLRAGFDGKAPTGSSAGTRCSERTFGHLGFTGTSVWCDPKSGMVTAILTNRVCPSRTRLGIREARPRIHDALFAFGDATRTQLQHNCVSNRDDWTTFAPDPRADTHLL